MTNDIEEKVWQALAAYPVRREMLGRERFRAIVATAIEQAPQSGEVLLTEGGSESLRERWEQRVRLVYRDNCGFAFTTMIMMWAISAIVQALAVRLWNKWHEVET